MQRGLSEKTKKLLEEILNEQSQGKKKEPKSATSTKKSSLGSVVRSTSPSKKGLGDALENEMKEHE